MNTILELTFAIITIFIAMSITIYAYVATHFSMPKLIKLIIVCTLVLIMV